MPKAELVVLDTHVWLWWTDGQHPLSAAARRAVDRATTVLVPAVCLWEIGALVARNRIRLDGDDPLSWMKLALAEDRVELAALSPEVAAIAADLGREGFHGDPIDRLIYGTARAADATLVSADTGMRAFEKALPARRGRHVVW
jgi:PIN domain nuclease of toxin-antitoxin system